MSSLRLNYFSNIALWDIHIECSIAPKKIVVIIHTIHVRNALTCTNFNLVVLFYEQITPQSVFMLTYTLKCVWCSTKTIFNLYVSQRSQIQS